MSGGADSQHVATLTLSKIDNNKLKQITIMYYHPFTTGNQSLPGGSNPSLDFFFGRSHYGHEVKDEIITENFFS